jgi:hypothetical protein
MVTKHRRGQHPKSLANLKPPAQSGEVRNPLGINRKRPWTDRYAQRSEDLLPEKLRVKLNHEVGAEALPEGSTWADAAVLRRFIEASANGGTPAAKEIADRAEGKATTFEEEKVDAKESNVYLVVGEASVNKEMHTIVGNVELTGAINKPRRSQT